MGTGYDVILIFTPNELDSVFCLYVILLCIYANLSVLGESSGCEIDRIADHVTQRHAAHLIGLFCIPMVSINLQLQI